MCAKVDIVVLKVRQLLLVVGGMSLTVMFNVSSFHNN